MFLRRIPQAVSHEVNNTELHVNERPDSACRVRQPLQAVAAQHQHIVDTAMLEFAQHPQPKLCGLAASRADPQPQDITFAVHVDTHRDIHGSVRDVAVADLDPDPINQDHRIDRIERPGLPYLHIGNDPVGDPRDRRPINTR
jgi:hypothetical protein